MEFPDDATLKPTTPQLLVYDGWAMQRTCAEKIPTIYFPMRQDVLVTHAKNVTTEYDVCIWTNLLYDDVLKVPVRVDVAHPSPRTFVTYDCSRIKITQAFDVLSKTFVVRMHEAPDMAGVIIQSRDEWPTLTMGLDKDYEVFVAIMCHTVSRGTVLVVEPGTENMLNHKIDIFHDATILTFKPYGSDATYERFHALVEAKQIHSVFFQQLFGKGTPSQFETIYTCETPVMTALLELPRYMDAGSPFGRIPIMPTADNEDTKSEGGLDLEGPDYEACDSIGVHSILADELDISEPADIQGMLPLCATQDFMDLDQIKFDY